MKTLNIAKILFNIESETPLFTSQIDAPMLFNFAYKVIRPFLPEVWNVVCVMCVMWCVMCDVWCVCVWCVFSLCGCVFPKVRKPHTENSLVVIFALQATQKKVIFVSRTKDGSMPKELAEFFESHQLEEEYGGTLTRWANCSLSVTAKHMQLLLLYSFFFFFFLFFRCQLQQRIWTRALSGKWKGNLGGENQEERGV